MAEAVEQPAASGALAELTLTLPLNSSSTQHIQKPVLVHYARGTDAMHLDQEWLIRWHPKNGGPYPDFVGQLTVRADYDYSTSILELEGDYEPPLGALGRAFDAVAGSHIAAVTVHELLRALGKRMEHRYVLEEDAKAELRRRETA